MINILPLLTAKQHYREAQQQLESMAKGELSREIPLRHHNEISAMLRSMSTLQESVKMLAADTGILIGAAVNGNLSTRADPDRHQGDFRNIVGTSTRSRTASTGVSMPLTF